MAFRLKKADHCIEIVKTLLIGISLLLPYLNADGQTSQEDNRITYSIFSAGGRSIFRSDIDGPSKFPSTEIRLGGSVAFKIASQFDILTRLNFGAKLKRETYNKPGRLYTLTGPFMDLDEMSGRTHYFFEIPVLIQYRFEHPKLNVGAGINYRKFFARKYVQHWGFDTFSSNNELGALGRLAYRLTPEFTLGMEYCIGLTKIYSVGGIYNGEEYSMSTRNEFVQFTLEYKLNFGEGTQRN